MTKVVLILALVLAVAPWGEAIAARKALVIGIGSYQHFNDLSTPPADARVFAETLQRFGFEVQQPSGSDIDSLNAALDRFLRSLKRQDEALFFFSGHSMQRDGDNFLFATDSEVDEFSTIIAINNHAVNVTHLVREMEARATLALVFLDACRTIQLPGNKSLGNAKGFTFQKVGVQQAASFIGFASQENQAAFTGDGALSHYTAALVAALRDDALAREPLPQLYSHVRRKVREATQESQSPAYRNHLGNREFRFARLTLIPEETTLTVRTEPTNAQVHVATSTGSFYRDGMRLQPGTYDVTVEAQGHERFQQRLAVDGHTEYRVSLCRWEQRTERVCRNESIEEHRTEVDWEEETLEDYEFGEPSDYLSVAQLQQLEMSVALYNNPYYLTGLAMDLTRANCDYATEKLKRTLREECEDDLDGRLISRSYDVSCSSCAWNLCEAEGTVECRVRKERSVPYETTKTICSDKPKTERICPHRVLTRLQ